MPKILIAELVDDVQKMFHAFTKHAKKLNKESLNNTTKCMTRAMEHLRCKLAIERTTIDQIMFFEHLRCKITRTGFQEDAGRRQANKVTAISGHLKHSIEMVTQRAITGYILNDRQRNLKWLTKE